MEWKDVPVVWTPGRLSLGSGLPAPCCAWAGSCRAPRAWALGARFEGVATPWPPCSSGPPGNLGLSGGLMGTADGPGKAHARGGLAGRCTRACTSVSPSASLSLLFPRSRLSFHGVRVVHVSGACILALPGLGLHLVSLVRVVRTTGEVPPLVGGALGPGGRSPPWAGLWGSGLLGLCCSRGPTAVFVTWHSHLA